MQEIGILVENSKELEEVLDFAQETRKARSLRIKIFSTERLYQDKISERVLQSRQSELDEIFIFPYHEAQPFSYLNPLKKIKIALQAALSLRRFFSTSDLVLVGIQTIFVRALYSVFLGKKIIVSYHRHFLTHIDELGHQFDTPFWRIVLSPLRLFGLDTLFATPSGVGFAHFYLVSGECNRKYLEIEGIRPHQIEVIGTPEIYDTLVCRQNVERTGKICFVCSGYEWYADFESDRQQLEHIKKLTGDWPSLIIRPHPREKFDKYLRFEGVNGATLQKPGSASVHKQLEQVEVLIGAFSTLMFEQALAGKTIIFLSDQSQTKIYQQFLLKYPLPLCSSPEEVSTLIGKLNSDREFRRQYHADILKISKDVIYFDKSRDPRVSASLRLGRLLEQNT